MRRRSVPARAALDREPEALEPRLALSAALRDQGCYAAAVQVLEEGEALHGRNEEFQARLRTARSNVSEQQYIEGLGRAEEAAKAQRNLLRCAQLSDLTACDEALKGRPNDPQILAAQGDALLKAGRPAEAAVAYRRASAIEPANAALAARISAAEQQRTRLVSECSTGERCSGGAGLRCGPDSGRCGRVLRSSNARASCCRAWANRRGRSTPTSPRIP